MDSSLVAYLPQDRRLALAQGEPLREHTHGAALFADIAGFTPLTEALGRALGARRGVEALVQQINHVYTALVAQVEQFGGSVIGFAGDSITCWFSDEKVKGKRQKATADDQDPPFIFYLLPSAQRATACALAMQAAMRQFAAIALPDETTTPLALKIAIASGPARRFVVGDPAIQLVDILAGETVSRMAAGEHLAQPGEILIDVPTVAALGDTIQVAEWRVDQETSVRFGVIATTDHTPLISNPVTLSPCHLVTLSPEHLRPWLLPAVYARHQAGLGDFLTELRPVVALFLRFGGIDYDGDLDAGTKLDSFIRRVQAILARYDGALLQLTIGDKGSYLYAAFGAPIAHEDDPVRAAHAALDLLALPDALDFLAPLQIGISRGVMRTGACGGTTRRSYAVMGDEVNLAARLMSQAAPGDALLSGRVHAALAREFELEPLAPITIKGMPEPLPIFRLAGRRARAVRLTEPAYALPMVGRATELKLIGAKLDLALAGNGQMIGISAEAGMGKSRLVAEILRLARRRGLRSVGGACQSYGTHTPYLVWGSIWRALFDLDPDWPARKQIRMLESTIMDMAPERRDALPLLGPLLDLPLLENDFTAKLEPQFRKSALEALLIDCLQAAARETAADGSGLLFVLEDLHWIDALSHDLLEAVARAIVDRPILIVAAYRPPELLRLQSPRVEALPHFTRIDLAPLTDVEAAQAIRAKLAQLLPERKGAATPALIACITQKAQGNPFYVEELLNYLRDRGIDPQDTIALQSLDLPASLHTLILSRIDQLSERERAAIKVASVIGRLFRFAHLHGAYPVLGDAALLRADLDALARLDLTPLDTPEPELTYLFKHIVTQEVAYASLTAQARASLHEQLAAYLEQVAGEHTDRFIDLLAYHYDRSDNIAKKRHYLRRAGEAVAARFANDAAIDYLSRALALAPEDDPAERFALLLEREKIYDLQSARPAQAQDLAALEALAEQLNDKRRRAIVAVRRSNYDYASYAADSAGIISAAAEAVAFAEAAHEAAIVAEAYCLWAGALIDQGDLAAAHIKATASLDLARSVGDQSSTAKALAVLGNIELGRQDYASAQGYYEQSLQIARSAGDRRSEGVALGQLARVTLGQQEYVPALSYFEQSLHLFRSIGDRSGETWILGGLGRLAMHHGNQRSAREYLDQSRRTSQMINDSLGEAQLIGGFGWAMQSMGDYSTARAYHEQSLAIVRATNNHYSASFSYNNLGTVARNQGNLSDARSWYQQALGSARAANHQQQEGVALWGLGNVALDSGELDRAEEMYRAAEAMFEAGGHEARVIEAVAGLAAVALARHDLAQAHAERIVDYLAHSSLNIDNTEEPFRVELICYQALRAFGDPGAPAILESAYQRLQDRATKIPDVTLRRSFLENVPHHCEIVAAWAEAHGEE